MLDQVEIARESEDDDDSNYLKYWMTILPDVIDKLRAWSGGNLQKVAWTLVKDDQFPLDNICYLLFLDLVTWFDQPITSKMRYYRSETWVMLGHRNTRSSLSEWDALSIWNTCHFLILSGLLMMGFISVYIYNGHVI